MNSRGPARLGALPMVAAIALTMLTAGCDEKPPAGQPTSRFARDVSDSRLFAAYRQTDLVRHAQLAFKADSRHVRINIQCTSDKGVLRIELDGRPSGGMGCGRPVEGGSLSFVNRSRPRAHSVELTIRAPRASSWSIAIDAGPRLTSPALP